MQHKAKIEGKTIFLNLRAKYENIIKNKAIIDRVLIDLPLSILFVSA